jgi:hypothetical protein
MICYICKNKKNKVKKYKVSDDVFIKYRIDDSKDLLLIFQISNTAYYLELDINLLKRIIKILIKILSNLLKEDISLIKEYSVCEGTGKRNSLGGDTPCINCEEKGYLFL